MAKQITPKQGDRFQPWNTNSIATVERVTPSVVTLRYDHDNERTHEYERKAFTDQVGRIVGFQHPIHRG